MIAIGQTGNWEESMRFGVTGLQAAECCRESNFDWATQKLITASKTGRLRPLSQACSIRCSLALFSALLLTIALAVPAAALEAFPGAEGYGQMTKGGRGGEIIYVTNLDDAGRGSLRACAEGTGKRVCVFRVGGVIELETPLAITEPHAELSILGQSAPGGGILITIDPETESAIKTPVFIKNTSEVLVRHVRFRLQFQDGPEQTGNGLTIENSQRVYIDHISTSWALDENIATHKTTTDLTIAYSIFAEGLLHHSKCALLGSDPEGAQKISFWRNMCVSNNDRNPDSNHYGGSCIEIVNNLFYNARSEWSEIFSQFPGGTPISYVGNYYKGGPSTLDTTFAIVWQDIETSEKPKIFASRNVASSPNEKTIALFAPDTEPLLVADPPCPLEVGVINDAGAAYDEVLASSGAFPRDAVDQRLASEVGVRGTAGTGSLKSEPGRLPDVAGGEPYADSDGDGMADSVEEGFGAVPGKFDPWTDGDGDGWPNLDEFMQWASDQRLAGRYPN